MYIAPIFTYVYNTTQVKVSIKLNISRIKRKSQTVCRVLVQITKAFPKAIFFCEVTPLILIVYNSTLDFPYSIILSYSFNTDDKPRGISCSASLCNAW